MGGGSSLEAVNFIVKMEQEFGIKFPDEWIHEAMKPTHIEQQIRQLLGNTTALTNTQTDDLFHVYAFPPLKGMIPHTREFLRVLGTHVPLTLIDYPRFETWEKDDICIEKIANTIDKNLFQKGKLKIFIGHCSGDHLAFCILNRLSEVYPLENLHFFIMDSWNHHYHFKGLTPYRINHIIKRVRHVGLWTVFKAAFIFRKRRLINKLTKNDFTKARAYDYAQAKIPMENYPFKSMNINAHLLISSENSYSADMGWLYYLPKLTSETFPFKHLEMYKDEENQQVVLEKLLSFIEEAKRNYTSVK
jgi:surfactin synthase thioesterase subunit